MLCTGIKAGAANSQRAKSITASTAAHMNRFGTGMLFSFGLARKCGISRNISSVYGGGKGSGAGSATAEAAGSATAEAPLFGGAAAGPGTADAPNPGGAGGCDSGRGGGRFGIGGMAAFFCRANEPLPALFPAPFLGTPMALAPAATSTGAPCRFHRG